MPLAVRARQVVASGAKGLALIPVLRDTGLAELVYAGGLALGLAHRGLTCCGSPSSPTPTPLGSGSRCPRQSPNSSSGVDVILHAGDVCTPDVLDELAAFAPVHVVLGNNDGPDVAAWGAPETLEIELDGLQVAMIHDSGSEGWSGRPGCGACSRMPTSWCSATRTSRGTPNAHGQRLFNPGSPTDKRRQPRGTMGQLVIDDGVLVSAEIVPVS